MAAAESVAEATLDASVEAAVEAAAAESVETAAGADAAESVADGADALAGALDEPTGSTTQELTSCTRGSPFAPVTGVKVSVQVCNMGPDALFSAHKYGQTIKTLYNDIMTYVCKVDCVCTVMGWVSDPSFWRSTREGSVLRWSTAGRAYAKTESRCRSKHKDTEFLSIVLQLRSVDCVRVLGRVFG